MRNLIIFLPAILWFSCNGQSDTKKIVASTTDTLKKNESGTVDDYYIKNKGNANQSKSLGTVSSGTLIDGKLIPFNGSNFSYFDTLSYLNGRGFLNSKTRDVVTECYNQLAKEVPGRKFCIMECSNKDGGKLFPHRTHQNGLSIDFMMPLVKNGKDYYGLDTLGSGHYWLSFDNSGRYSEDTSICIDFNLVARHILLLEEIARKHGLKISKVIINTNLKDELFATPYGKELKSKEIYIVQNLTPLLNMLHDDHYHIDFEEI